MRVLASAAMSRWWPHIRAALVSFHLLAIVLVAIPAPVGGMSRGSWKEPTVQAELAIWSRILRVPQPVLEKRLYSLASTYMDARSAVLRPIRPYIAATGTDQPWRMFVAPHRYPARYQVQARGPGPFASPEADWQTLFEERSPTYRWRESFFEQERVRSVLFRYAWPEYSGDARRTCEWIAREIRAEDPSRTEVRCRYWKARSPTAREVREGCIPDGAWVQVKTVRRPPL